MFKLWVQKSLAGVARAILAKYRPKIIGITGSVGKTSARDAIFAVVQTSYRARKPHKNFNNEFGLPFAILGEDSPGRNPVHWLGLWVRALKTLWFGPFPQVLVLEMGVDRPGDMDYLLSIAKPDIAVVTSIGLSHYEFFKTYDAVLAEKGKLVEALSPAGTAVLNADNERAKSLMNKTKARVICYSTRSATDVSTELQSEQLSTPASSTLKIHAPNRQLTATVPVIGEAHISALTSAIAVATILDIDDDALLAGLQSYRPVPGRLNILNGIKGTTLIDDTYNASPESAAVALALLARHPAKHKIAVLGDMLELGSESVEAHREIGHLVAQLKVDQLLAFGPESKLLADTAIQSGMQPQSASHFTNQDDLIEALLKLLQPGTAVLIKGSQGMRLEKVTKELLAEPMTASHVLCRQYGKWLSS